MRRRDPPLPISDTSRAGPIVRVGPIVYVVPNEVRDLGFCSWQQRPGFLASLGTTKQPPRRIHS